MKGTAQKQGNVRGAFLTILGFLLLGIGASIYYGELGFGNYGLGSLSKESAPHSVVNGFGLIPLGLGVLLIIVGIGTAIMDRRR